MRVIALHADMDTSNVRSDLSEVESTWVVVDFTTPGDLINQLASIKKKLTQVEIVADGSPRYLDGIAPSVFSAHKFGLRLKDVPQLTSTSKIYLSGCNTGCVAVGATIAKGMAQRIANAALMRVYGAVGYIIGSHAVGNEVVEADDGEGDIYEGAKPHAIGSACWRQFTPTMERAVSPEKAQGPELVLGFEKGLIRFAPSFQQEIISAVAEVMATESIADSRSRVGPDLVFSVPGHGGEPIVLELIGNGTLLRDRATRRRWRFPLGKRMLIAAAPLLDRDDDPADDSEKGPRQR